MKTMCKRYENAISMGTITLCNVFGVAVFEPDEIDRYKDNCDLIVAWCDSEGYSGFHKHKIHYTKSGRAYIRKGSFRFYLDQIMRNDIL